MKECSCSHLCKNERLVPTVNRILWVFYSQLAGIIPCLWSTEKQIDLLTKKKTIYSLLTIRRVNHLDRFNFVRIIHLVEWILFCWSLFATRCRPGFSLNKNIKHIFKWTNRKRFEQHVMFPQIKLSKVFHVFIFSNRL